MKHQCDFSGWATRVNLRCSDGRTIMKGAFDDNDGKKVPLVWNHVHNDPTGVLGHAILEKRDDGIYAYCSFNDSPNAQVMKQAVLHGDIEALSIFANQLKEQAGFVTHGNIREVSLVMAGANPGAFIDSLMAHGEESGDEAIIYTGEPLSLAHADDPKEEPKKEEPPKEAKPQEPPKKEEKPEEDETIGDVYNTLTEKQKRVVNYIVGDALAQGGASDAGGKSDDDAAAKHSEGGDTIMKHNIFEKNEAPEATLSHADREGIISLAKQNSVGSLQTALKIYAEQAEAEGDASLQHSISNIESLFPDFKDLRPGAPELITRDQGWVDAVMQKVNKSPISRIRTRQMDARNPNYRAQGYQKGKQKKYAGNMTLISRTTDPQTVYCIDALSRDDIVDITDFDVIEYQFGVMRQLLNEEVALAIMVGDGREEGEEMKISESHIRSIWNDDDLYTIHYDIDIAAAKAELQGTNTSANFGENYVYAEAVVTGSLYAREKYKGTGTPDLFCTPHMLNVMLLARDLNGRRIYDSKTELAAALNVKEIYTVEQFEGLIRNDSIKNHKLLGIITNLADYTVGSTKGGEITKFDQFDIDFNRQKLLIETRLSGALTRLYSAIALEEPVNP